MKNTLATDDGRRREAGFSLIELLVVIVIIGILAAIVLTQVLHAYDKARQRATMADMRTLSKALAAYDVDLGFLPANGTPMSAMASVLVPYQANVVPQEDHWNHLYVYTTSGAGDYSLESYGKDGIDGTNISYATRWQFDQDIVLSNGIFTASPEM